MIFGQNRKIFSYLGSFFRPPRTSPLPFITICPRPSGVGVEGDEIAAACLRVLTPDIASCVSFPRLNSAPLPIVNGASTSLSFQKKLILSSCVKGRFEGAEGVAGGVLIESQAVKTGWNEEAQ